MAVIKIAFCTIIFSASLYAPAFASRADNLRVAILDFESSKEQRELASFAVSSLTEKLFLTKKFTLIERSQIDIILKEQGL